MNITSFPRLSRYMLFLLVFLSLAALAVEDARRSEAKDGPTPLVSGGETYGEARVSVGSLNIRTGPHISYTAVAYLMEGEEVHLVGRNRTSTWVQIRLYNGYRGWVNVAYILPTIDITALPIVDVALLGITAFVTNDPIPVYTGPGSGYQLIDRAQPGDVLALNGRDASAGWVHVYLPDGRAGWAAADSSFLPSASLNDLPIIAPFLDALPPNLAPFFLVYNGPGFIYDPVDSVKEGQSLGILARTADSRWVQVRLPDGREGWIAAEIVHIDAALANVPVITGIAPPQVVGWMAGGQSSDAAEQPTEQPTAQPTDLPTEQPTDEPEPTPTTAGGGKQTAPAPATAEPEDTPEPGVTATTTATPTPLPEATATKGATTTATPDSDTGEEMPPPGGIPIVYVYATPNEDSAPILRVVPGQSVVLTGRTEDEQWIKIWLPGNQEGWVRAEMLQLDIDISVLPVVAP